jgi:short subunit dehydrogenase-like uncharacterized protein
VPGGGPDRAHRGPIVVYGASGFTGKLIAAELTERGADVILAGRDRAKLEGVAEGLGGATEIAAVPLSDGPGLRELVEGAAVVIGCAGPFTLHGRPLIETAARGGSRYLDTTGEQPFIRESFERWGDVAAESGAALVSGMGFDYAPGDMLASLVADGLGPLDEMTLAYTLRGFTPTRGTTLSALEMMRGGDVELRDGALVPAGRSVGRGRFEFPSPIGSRRVGRYMSGEQITVPRHVDVRTLRTVIDLRALLPLPAPAEGLSAGLLNAGGRAMETRLRGALGKLVNRLPEGPEEDDRRAVRFTIVCEARAGTTTRRGVVRGSDVYGITAVMLAHGAIRMAAEDYAPRGALAPAQAFEPRAFLEALEPFGLSFEVGEPQS